MAIGNVYVIAAIAIVGGGLFGYVFRPQGFSAQGNGANY